MLTVWLLTLQALFTEEPSEGDGFICNRVLDAIHIVNFTQYGFHSMVS